jgi:hypothetical protein
MTKETITRIWVAGIIVSVAGLLMAGISLGLMLAYGGHFTPAPGGNGRDFVPNFDGFFWTMIGLAITGVAIAAIGGVMQLAGWIGALVNTYQMQDKTWFIVLLAGGLLGLSFALVGFATMVAYVVAGPDGLAPEQRHMPPADLRPALAPQG